jgi:GT2 family glycosyltransferase
VTYGTFAPGRVGGEYGAPDTVDRDFQHMASCGINAVRVYTVPPRWLLGTALKHGLRVLIGLPWEQHVAFLDDREMIQSIEERVREGVRSCAGHPAVLGYAVGNEIPGPIVRWYGAKRVERFLLRLARVVKQQDPGALVTYVNYPTTEYLQLPFVDFLSFNVYLESRERLESYLARLQNLAGDKPLVMAEIGLDSRRNGLQEQAHVLGWQIQTAFAAGVAGAFVFAWTDRWHRGGYDIEDWDFGLVTRDGQPKPALEAVYKTFAKVPFPRAGDWPRISVVVCSHNGAATLADCCEGIKEIDYPNFEAILVDDGSTDHTSMIAYRYGLKVIRTENRGLSAARNTGYQAASGEIVAYIDDDARPDPHWLRYLASSFKCTGHVGFGGPNIAPSGDGFVADCVARSPGGPAHVLLTDETAEHIPGCNMAYRKTALEAVGGFDPVYRAAGDDVDVCWRLHERGWTLGFSPAAMVWHHQRNSIRAYWRQQVGYGKAEALLERNWPEKYNAAGHLAWMGRVYSKDPGPAFTRRGRIYGGVWGSAPFQRVYEQFPGVLRSLPLMPEWYLVVGALTVLSILGMTWAPLLAALPLLFVAFLAPVAQAILGASRAPFNTVGLPWSERFRLRALVAFLHLVQPVARLRGRLIHGLTPWRLRLPRGLAAPLPRIVTIWREEWQPAEQWLARVECHLRELGAVSHRGGVFDRWDLQTFGGTFGSARLRFALEEHGAGRQLARFHLWPRPSWLTMSLLPGFLLLAGTAMWSGALIASVVCATVALALGTRVIVDMSGAVGFVLRALALSQAQDDEERGARCDPEAVDALLRAITGRTAIAPASALRLVRHDESQEEIG